MTIPPGTYELTQPLLVKTAETRIQGAGASTHLVNKNEEGQPLLLLQAGNLGQDPKAKLWRVQVVDLRISGNPKSGDGILAENIKEIFLHGVSIDHTAATASTSSTATRTRASTTASSRTTSRPA